MKHKKTKIKCDVAECIYNNNEENDCTLGKIKISRGSRGTIDRCENSTSSSTVCESFEKRCGIITDNEYEIKCEIDENENVLKLEKEANSK